MLLLLLLAKQASGPCLPLHGGGCRECHRPEKKSHMFNSQFSIGTAYILLVYSLTAINTLLNGYVHYLKTLVLVLVGLSVDGG